MPSSLRKGGGLVDAPGEWLVGPEGNCPVVGEPSCVDACEPSEPRLAVMTFGGWGRLSRVCSHDVAGAGSGVNFETLPPVQVASGLRVLPHPAAICTVEAQNLKAHGLPERNGIQEVVGSTPIGSTFFTGLRR